MRRYSVLINGQQINCVLDDELFAFFNLIRKWFAWSQTIGPKQHVSFNSPRSIVVCTGQIPNAQKRGRDWIFCGFTSATQGKIVIHNELNTLEKYAVMFHEFFHLSLNGERAVHRSALFFLYKLWFHYDSFALACSVVPSREHLKLYLDILSRTAHYFGLSATEVNAIFDVVKRSN